MGQRTNLKTYIVILVFSLGTVCTNAMGGTTFLTEGFESAFVSGAPPGWTKSFKTGTVDWTRNIGDHNGGTAHGGTYNAMLYYGGTSDHETYLITPVIDLGGATNTTLEFWHKQANWSGDQDTLKVYYKTSAGGSWILLASYLSDVSTWTKRTISLPNPCSTYYIGFLGNAKYGYGVCIDDVKVYESGGDGVVTYHAVVCGIENYQGSLYDLDYCHEDADGFRDGLLDWPNWNSTNITLLKYSVTKSQIQTAIQNMCAAADEDDVCVFYFAGHGWAGTDVDPYDENDGLDEYLVTYDGLVWDSYWDEYYIDPDKCIRDDELGDWMADCLGKYAVFLDACYSGGQIRGLAKVRGIGDIVPAKGDGFAADLVARMQTRDLDDNGYGVVVTACDDDETCAESHSLEHGIFTYCLLIGMGGAADDNYNDRISAEECYDYARPCALTYNPDQHAQMYDGHPGELEFLCEVECAITVTSPTSSSTWECGNCYYINWDSEYNPSNYVKIQLYKGSSLVQTITSSTTDDGSYSWCVPEDITPQCDYRIKITSTTDTSCYDYSDYFCITCCSITVTSPDGEQWEIGKTLPIRWSSGGYSGNVKIELYKGGFLECVIEESLSNTGSYDWPIPIDCSLMVSEDYQVKVAAVSNPSCYDYSNSFGICGILGDFEPDCDVDWDDLAVFIEQWLLPELSMDVMPSGGDGIVNFLDWAVFADGWQDTTDMDDLAVFVDQWLQLSAYSADIFPTPEGDGTVNMFDFAVFADNWLVGVE